MKGKGNRSIGTGTRRTRTRRKWRSRNGREAGEQGLHGGEKKDEGRKRIRRKRGKRCSGDTY